MTRREFIKLSAVLALAGASAACSGGGRAPSVGADANILVAYFSATGNTEEAAGYIASLTGGDLFEITPADPYTADDLNWGDSQSRVSTEHDTIESGGTVTVALTQTTPATGKTVIPFCTSSSSGIGQSGALLAEMAGTGDWRQGRRFSSSVSEGDVRAWLNGMGL